MSAGDVVEPARLSIGEVISRLRPDHPDISISKIRFLEAEGLVTPKRSASGYRKFDEDDLRRLQYVLRMQRDHYLPLRVIRDHLDAMDRGLEPPSTVDRSPRAPRVEAAEVAELLADNDSELRLSRRELLEATGLADEQLRLLESYGLLGPRPDGKHYDQGALRVAAVVAELAEFGLEPRHLRSFKVVADREVGLVEAVVRPLLHQRDAAAQRRAAQTAQELARRAAQLHVALLRAGIARLLGEQ